MRVASLKGLHRALSARRVTQASGAIAVSLLGGCAVYEPVPAVYGDPALTYSAPPAVVAPGYAVAPYAVAPYPVAPYYVGPPVSLGLWFGGGYYHGGGGRYYGHGGGRYYGHGRGGWGGRHR